MKHARTMANPPTEVSAWSATRDRLAYLITKRARLWRGVVCGLLMAWVVLSACSLPTSLSHWSILLALGVFGISFLDPRFSGALMGLICTVQMLSMVPALGWITFGLAILFVLVSIPYSGYACAVLATPYLMTIHCGIAVPLGLAAASRKRSSWFWGGTAFLWAAAHGFATGQARLGIPLLPGYAQAITAINGKVPVFGQKWLRAVVGDSDISGVRDTVLGCLTNPATGVPFALQFVLWTGVAYLVRILYVRHRRRLKDRLALAYLEKVTAQKKEKKSPFFRQLIGTMVVGVLLFVITYIVLAVTYKSIHYGALAACMDIVAAAIAWFPLTVLLDGDRHLGKMSKKDRLLHEAESFNELPVGDSGAFSSSRVQRPAPASGGYARKGARSGPSRRSHPAPLPRAHPPSRAPVEVKTNWKPPTVVPVDTPTTRTPDGGNVTFTVEAVVFIDMVGSTAMGSRLGDAYVLSLKEKLGKFVREESANQGVLFLKGTGDGHMLTFPDAPNAVSASLGIMQRVRELNTGLPPGRTLHLRFGIHMGEVNINSQGDRIGTAANFAARIEGAKREQIRASEEDPEQIAFPEQDRIFVSETVKEVLGDTAGVKFRPLGYFEFKGISGLHRIFELNLP